MLSEGAAVEVAVGERGRLESDGLGCWRIRWPDGEESGLYMHAAVLLRIKQGTWKLV